MHVIVKLIGGDGINLDMPGLPLTASDATFSLIFLRFTHLWYLYGLVKMVWFKGKRNP